MKKVLALVLALTMVLGFASTTFAARTYDLFNADPAFKVGDDKYDDNMEVEGNKEYTVKATFTGDDLVDFIDFSAADNKIRAEYIALNVLDRFDTSYFKAMAYADMTDDIEDAIDAALDNADTSLTAADTTIWDAFNTAGIVAGATVKDAFAAIKTLRSKTEKAYEDWNPYSEYYLRVSATPKDSTYATVTTTPTLKLKTTWDATNSVFVNTYTAEFKVRFTNTTFKTVETKVDVLFRSNTGGVDVYEDKYTLIFDVEQAQSKTFTEDDADRLFYYNDNIEISAKDYAYIASGAFKLMKQNDNRSITVISGMGESKVRFDKDSTNLPQDVFIGNFKTSNTGTTAASISGFSSSTSAKIKIAVGQSFYTANTNKALAVFDVNGNKLDVEVTLQGDYTVNFFAPLSSYTVAAADWDGQKAPETGKTNPSMGGK